MRRLIHPHTSAVSSLTWIEHAHVIITSGHDGKVLNHLCQSVYSFIIFMRSKWLIFIRARRLESSVTGTIVKQTKFIYITRPDGAVGASAAASEPSEAAAAVTSALRYKIYSLFYFICVFFHLFV
jgi:hypothetical protein